MFNLLKRSKNRKSQRQDSNLDGLAAKNLPLSKTLNELDNFHHVEGSTNVDGKKMPTDEREEKFANIYFESGKGKSKDSLHAETKGNQTISHSTNDSDIVSSSSSSGKTNDSTSISTATSTSNQECRNLAKRKYAKRRSLGFRRVDLDGINSIIEAVVLDGEDDDDDDDNDGEVENYVNNEDSGAHDKESTAIEIDRSRHADKSGTEQSGVDAKLLSQNERAELSGRNSSIHSDASNSVKLQSNVKNTVSIAFDHNDLSATKLDGAGNVRNIDQNEATTSRNNNSINGNERVASSEKSTDSTKQIKRERRRSLFQRKSCEPIIEESAANFEGNAKNLEQIDIKKNQGPLQKGKKFLSNIFMARGRHNHNQQHQNQRNRNQSTPLQPSSSKQLQQEPCSSNSKCINDDQNAAVTADHNNCQNATVNKDNLTISNDTRNAQNCIENDQNNSLAMIQRRRHLETTNSPIRQRDPAASVQMTLSNNSLKNASCRDASTYAIATATSEGKPHQRSNSAELPREYRETERKKNNDGSKTERAYSEEPREDRQYWSGAHGARARVPFTKESLPNAMHTSSPRDDQLFTRAGSIKKNGVNAENSDNFIVRNTTDKEINERPRIPNDERTELPKLTECMRQLKSSQYEKQDNVNEEQKFNVNAAPMGQTYGKNETNAESTRASTPNKFRESKLPEAGKTSFSTRPAIVVPKITVEDFSFDQSAPNNNDQNQYENEVFYDFDNSECLKTNPPKCDILLNNDEDVDYDVDDEIFHEQVSTSQPNSFSNSYRQHSPLRHSPAKLEDVPEQEENEDDEVENCNARFQRTTSLSVSPDRFQLKSSESNLSNSYPDSGISGCSEPLTKSMTENNNAGKSTTTTTTTPTVRSTLSTQTHRRHRSPFVRDSTSTECDDTILQCDEFDCFIPTLDSSCSSQTTIGTVGDRLVCIESISLPDVVESTTSTIPGSGNGQNGTATSPSSTNAGGEQIININGATGNSIGNVHFIPIQVESEHSHDSGQRRSNSPNKQKQRSFDDSVIVNGMKSTRFAHLNGNFDLSDKPTIEVIEDEEPSKLDKNSSFGNNSEKMRLEFDEQKSRLNVQLDDAQKNVQNLQIKISEMQTKIGNLEQELSTKTWNVERLQSELNASQREDEFVRKKLRLLQEEKTELRHKFNENEDEFKRKYDELEIQYKELQEKYKNTQTLASGLHTQLAVAKSEAEKWRNEVDKIRSELDEQIRILKNALENSEAERKICEDKWQKEYELLRTQHMDREETLMTDCEWQLRQMQKQWKDKLDKSEQARREAVDAAELIQIELETRKREVNDLRHYEAEVKSLRGVVTEQQNSITTLMNQIETLKSDLHTAKQRLEEQIEAVSKIKFQCENAIYDKERQMVYRIDEVRNEAACFWENKLYTEMTRLKSELESVYVDERREALDKLQAEHIEELRALTTRYTANEDELRTELAEIQERLELKSTEFLELREKSDNDLLKTRMHLDRADREYQNAMCREEERREALEESLKTEFEAEKQEMESKFQERLSEVKEEFSTELQNSKQELAEEYQKNLAQITAQLRAEKDEALQELSERHRQKLAAADERMKEMELRHQNDLKELKASYDEDKALLDKRDMSNANEIEQLHRRCRCLTNLFEEMRMRYERRDPRPEDLREIEELRTRCESQERDLFTLTAKLREMQMEMQQTNDKANNNQTKKGGKLIQKPPPKIIPTNCDVIYEENEERDSPPPNVSLTDHQNSDDDDDDSNEEYNENDNDRKIEENSSLIGTSN